MVNYTVNIIQHFGFNTQVTTTLIRSPIAVSNLITLSIFISIMYTFQYFLFKFLEDLPNGNFKKLKNKKLKEFLNSLNKLNLVMILLMFLITYILTHIPKINIFISSFLGSLLDVSNFNFNLTSQHFFLIFFLTFVIFIPRFLVKLIENFGKNTCTVNIYYIVLIILFSFVIWKMLYFSIHEGRQINYLEPIIKWFNLNYSSP